MLVEEWKSVFIKLLTWTMTDANRLSDTILQDVSHLEFNYIDESEEELIEEVSRAFEKYKFIFW